MQARPHCLYRHRHRPHFNIHLLYRPPFGIQYRRVRLHDYHGGHSSGEFDFSWHGGLEQHQGDLFSLERANSLGLSSFAITDLSAIMASDPAATVTWPPGGTG
jgi:hypothetical protein